MKGKFISESQSVKDVTGFDYNEYKMAKIELDKALDRINDTLILISRKVTTKVEVLRGQKKYWL